MNELEQTAKRGPGRPPKYHEVQAAQPVAEPVDAPRVRPNRKPFGTVHARLAYPLRENYHRHWFNDVADRVNRAVEAGYEHVKDELGKNVCRVVGTAESSGPLHAYLMEIPEEWYQADMAEQQKAVDEREAAMKRGEADRQDGDGRYVPAQGISIKRG